MKQLITFCALFFTLNAFGQYNVGIGTTAPAKDAILDIKSNSQGVLIPRLSTTQRLAIVSPSNGLMVFDTNFNCIYVYIAPSAAWQSYCPPPVGPPVNSNVKIYTAQGTSTRITDTAFTTVKGLSLTITLTDTATVILSSNGSMIGAYDDDCPISADSFAISVGNPPTPGYGIIQTIVRLYQNGVPLAGTDQSNHDAITYANDMPPPKMYCYTHWGVSAVIPLLPPGTYLFELKAAKTILNTMWSDDFFAARNYNNKNQGIITAEVIH